MNFTKKITPERIFISLAILATILICVQFFKDWSFPDTQWEIKKDDSIKFKEFHPITQKFTARKNNLSRIEILFGSSDKGESDGKITLEIYDERCASIVRKTNISSREFSSDETQKFNFKKIPNSKNKTYCLKMNFIPKIQNPKDLKVFTIENNSPENVYLQNSRKNKEYPNYSLSMRPGYKGENIIQDTKILTQRISQYKPWFLKNLPLFIIFFLAITLSIGSVIFLILI